MTSWSYKPYHPPEDASPALKEMHTIFVSGDRTFKLAKRLKELATQVRSDEREVAGSFIEAFLASMPLDE